jgi:hypothetical protein
LIGSISFSTTLFNFKHCKGLESNSDSKEE